MPESFNLNERVLNLEELPLVQSVASRLLELLSCDLADAQQIEELIQADPALTAKVLRVVNSAYYGVRNIVDTVKLAVVILGFEELRKLIASMMFMNLSNELLDNNHFDFKSFWRHSVTVAFFSEKLYSDFRIESHGEEFTAGLMHDIGKLVAGMTIPDYTIKVTEKAIGHSISVYEAEYHLYGTSHIELGGFLAERWNFPDPIVDCIFSHHGDPGKSVLTATVIIANKIANLLDEGTEINKTKDAVSVCSSWKILDAAYENKKKKDFDEYLEDFKQKLQDIDLFIESLL